MATPAQWLEGARPRTLPAAVSPVLAGTGVAAWQEGEIWWKAILALVLALALQVAVNYANDYSDGIRGTDEARVGPLRLVGSAAATPAAVKRAAFAAFGVAVVAGTALAVTTTWWLIVLGAGCIAAAWFYTGGAHPYGYLGLGEVMVFCFFGLVAVLGTAYVQTEQITLIGWYAAVGVGALACALLVANNLRDIPTDQAVGKRTLAVVLGDERTRYLYALLVGMAMVALVGVALGTSLRVLVGLVSLAFLGPALVTVLGRAPGSLQRGPSGRPTGSALVPVLQQTGLGELVYSLAIFVVLLVG
ncbi:MAG: 1,4-dihydroxy-2-naphthoate polyprenyltransferase [Actinomycetota bacterium]|nr:1,4-dihydroxy-2-naphthoate polyprenyltransferase [Actinomycetota bacterium]